jgi:DNA polymerase-3 subunit alpha
MKLNLLPPDVNQGEFQFTVDKENNIIYGLGAIKGLGEGPVDNIIEARKQGPFKNLFDFCARIDSRKVNKRALDALVRSGSFDTIGPDADNLDRDLDHTRAMLMASLSEAVKTAEQQQANTNAGMVDLFGDSLPGQGVEDGDAYEAFYNTRRWTMKERLNGENETIGLYLTGHPIDEYEEEIKHLVSSRISRLVADKKSIKIAGLVIAMRVMKTKRGDTMGFITLDDRTGRMEIAVFADTYNEYRDKMVKDALLIVEGQVSHDDYSGGLKMRANKIIPLEQARQEQLRTIGLRWNSRQLKPNCTRELMRLLDHYRVSEEGHQGCAVIVEYERADASAKIKLGQRWRVKPADELIQKLRNEFGKDNLFLGYGR